MRRRVVKSFPVPSPWLGWENSRNLCTQCIGINSQFAMRLAHALSHSPNSDADSLGLNLYQSFLRNPLTVILNLCINLVGLTSDTDYRSFASGMPMDVCQAFLHDDILRVLPPGQAFRGRREYSAQY